MSAPTTRNRIATLDFLRGIAVLGILWANIPLFAGPMLGMLQLTQVDTAGFWGVWGSAWHATLVAGKFRGMLAVLFGVGLWLQYVKRRSSGESWPGTYLRRTFWLCVLGVCHMLFLWLGDILVAYAATALVAVLFVTFSDRVLAVVSGILLAMNLSLAVLVLVAEALMSSAAPRGDQLSWLLQVVIPYSEATIFGSGTWVDQLALRALVTPFLVSFAVFLPLNLLHLFLIGILLARSGALARPSGSPKVRNLCLGVGFGIGLPLNALPFLKPLLGWDVSFQFLNEFGGNAFLCLGYLMLGAILVERGALRWLVSLFTPVGRFALSSYLFQSLLGSFVFYSWGLGLYGQLSGWWLAAAVLAIWAVVIASAHLWDRVAVVGPVEWAWRSLCERRKLPIWKVKARFEGAASA